ncbi:hypothetical protein JCM10212_004945 [Sporobolomyces blumeae]
MDPAAYSRYFRAQLTTDNAAYGLYSDVAACYPDVRDVALDFVVKHWAKVGKSDAFKAIKARAEQSAVDGLTGMLLSQRLMDQYGPGKG